MSQPTIPKVFDWVTARSKCSLHAVYRALFETVESDIKTMAARTEGMGIRYLCEHITHEKFSASRIIAKHGSMAEDMTVVFERLQDRVHVKGAKGETLFVAKPYVIPDGPEGRCVLEVEGRGPLELWQVSQMAVESLLFTD